MQDAGQTWTGSNPAAQNNEHCINGAPNDGDTLSLGPKGSVRGAEVRLRDGNGAIIWPEVFRNRWFLFVGGNLISAAVVISEISRVDGCFDEHREIKEYQFVTEESQDGTAEPEFYGEGSIRPIVIALLVFGLATEIISAVVLYFTYRSPLDIKSMRKIPPVDIRNHSCSAFVVFFLAPFSWGVMYIFGSYVTIQVDSFSSCGAPEGSGLIMYLVVSGLCMIVVGAGMLTLSVFGVFFSCGSPARCTDNCCSALKGAYRRRIMSTAPFFDIFWQMQGAVWLYRTGAVGAVGFFLLLVFCLVGAVLAASGSRAPGPTQGAAGAPPLGLTPLPDAADKT